MKQFLVLLMILFSFTVQAITTSVYTNYATTNISTTPTVLIASFSQPTQRADVFDSSGVALLLTITAPNGSKQYIYLPPGGESVPFYASGGSSVSISTLTGTVSSGFNILTVN